MCYIIVHVTKCFFHSLIRWFRQAEELIGQTSGVLAQKVDRDWHGAKVQCEAKNKVGSTRQSVILNVECEYAMLLHDICYKSS